MPSEHHHGDCRELFGLLSEYLDAELPSSTCQEIEAHLADCPPCMEFLKSLKKSIELSHGCETEERPTPLGPAERQALADAYRQMLARRAGKAI
jgi:anti-sigma factor RsiW